MNKTPGYQPLYQQVYNVLVERIVAGHWSAGEVLPSEFALADELGVSQGTVRKALNAMENNQLLIRHQGKGTFVAEHTEESSLFRFFRMARKKGGVKVVPESELKSIEKRKAKADEKIKLKLDENAKVVQINRVCFIDTKAALVEVVIVPVDLFPGIEDVDPLPNALYSLYQMQYGVVIVEADESIDAVVANSNDAELLGLEEGTPLLNIERVAVALDGSPVELRIYRCDTRELVYSTSIGK